MYVGHWFRAQERSTSKIFDFCKFLQESQGHDFFRCGGQKFLLIGTGLIEKEDKGHGRRIFVIDKERDSLQYGQARVVVP